MKTPEEIKKALECCQKITGCADCPYRGEKCALQVSGDTLEYIQQLEEGIDRVYELAKGLRLQISQIESQLAAPYKQATMKEVAECLKNMGINCCYGEDDHD